jgi:hypothetical protein
VGFGVGRGVATDQGGRALDQREALHDRHGEAVRLVGDDTPGDVLGFQRGQQFGHAVKQHGGVGQAAFVGVEKRGAQVFELGVAGMDVERRTDQPACACRGVGPQDLQRHGRQTPLHAQVVDRADEVAGGVGQGAIQIEQHGLRGLGPAQAISGRGAHGVRGLRQAIR